LVCEQCADEQFGDNQPYSIFGWYILYRKNSIPFQDVEDTSFFDKANNSLWIVGYLPLQH
jgi:hypothetical protein